MENKINIAELLKDCPSGMELGCTMYEDVYFDYVDELNIIHCYIQCENYKTSITFNQHGTPNSDIKSKCVIFPKGKTTWEGFVPPCQFKEGDIISNDMYIAIFYKADRPYTDFKRDALYYHCWYNRKYNEFKVETDYGIGLIEGYRLATEEEKTKLFQAIKENGYTWNEETKTLEKLPKFKVGDKIKYRSGEIVYRIVQITEDSYVLDNLCSISISIEHMYNLVPNKFDITTLKPFDKVLVRNTNKDYWMISMFGYISKGDKQYFMCIAKSGFYQCIPYEGNEHLLGTTNACDEYYKTW